MVDDVPTPQRDEVPEPLRGLPNRLLERPEAAVSAELRRAVWRSLLDADLNARYWDEMGRRYYRRDRWSKIFLAVTTSSAVASWGIWQPLDLAWQGLSALAAVVAVALPILDWPRAVETMAGLRGNWQQIQAKYESLFLDLEGEARPDEESRRELRATRQEEASIDRASANLPRDEKLAALCHRRVLASRGLGEEGAGDER